MTGGYVVWMRVNDGGFSAQVVTEGKPWRPHPEYASMQELLRVLYHRADSTFTVNVLKHHGIWKRLIEGASYEEAAQHIRAYQLGRLMQ